MSATTVVAAKQKRILRKFEEADASDPERARSLTDLDCRDSIVFRSLVRRGPIRETSDGRFWLDAEAARRMRARQRAIVLIAILLVVTMVIVTQWLG